MTYSDTMDKLIFFFYRSCARQLWPVAIVRVTVGNGWASTRVVPIYRKVFYQYEFGN